ncbi:MAG: DNA-binding protein [Desulfobacteraceae bacterium]|nr:DNA-binding protein [Desulfobacteraceae bacterium]
MMQLDDFKIPGKKLVVKGNMELRTEDIAGETSGTDSVDKGTKPKILRVTLTISFKQPQDLSALVKIAEAKTSAGERQIYKITNKTATAAGIRQVRFFESFNWSEADSMQMWDVSFSLQEYLSNPERAENRKENKDNKAPVADTTKLAQKAKEAEYFGR